MKDGSNHKYNLAVKSIDDVMDLAKIKQLSTAGRHQECLQACQNALQANPEQIYAYKYAGKSLLALAQFEKAQQYLAKAYQLDNNDPEIVKDIGNIFNALQSYTEAAKYYKLSLKIDPNYAPAGNNLGLIAKQQGDLQVAKQLIERARDLDPISVPFHLNLSSIYKELGQLDNALASTLQALELKYENPDAHINLAGIYKDLGQLDHALASTLKSLELKPNNANAHMNLGWIYKELGHLDHALASTLKSLELQPNNADVHMNLGWIYKELGQHDKALAPTLKSLELKPDNATAHMNLGGIYKELGHLDHALASTLKSLELQPNNADVHLNLGGIYLELGQLDHAFTAAKKSIALNSNNQNCYLLLSSLHLKAKNPAQANEASAKGLKINSKDIRLQHNQNAAISQITPAWHITMMNDVDRNKCYAEAIKKAIKPNDLVLDIGAGSGLLSMMAADAGASQVIACESTVPIANTTKLIVKKNGFEGKISVCGMKSTNIKIGEDMPRKADIIISEVFSSEMVGEGILQTLQDSRERLLKEGGLMIPEQAEIKFALIGASPEVSRKTTPGVDSCYILGDFSEICPRKIPVQLTEKPNFLSESETAFHFDFRKSFAFKAEKNIDITAQKDGECIGIIQWLKTNLFGDIIYENIPGKVYSHWCSNIYLFQSPISVRHGEVIRINSLVDKDMLWFQYDGLNKTNTSNTNNSHYGIPPLGDSFEDE